ncbi:MAG: dihydroneopterin aldolase [Eubacterium sp.]|nr:dihydroneopterin aldolase [Eubacterium sp.]
MDKITIKNLKIFAFHGVNPEEKENGQNFYIDVDYYVDIKKACKSDDVNDTVSYAKVVKVITAAFTKEKYNLIEKAAEKVADSIFDSFEDVFRVEITLKKPEAPVKADFDYMAVTITRERQSAK